ncbi:MAG: helix-turn-helix domain-containing protein [Actinobacteria bacterium]|nr:helix-turn-helix domain-containing protein [Actinomycetota bacterium]MCG2817861.1 helix-turn-helix domain-containing protein [Actinomycetes bacterium]MBU4217747.1 helix-turn-helix domain-containing protein [Actinomycetota bacterium]MBU4358940.1 helix-turn-helix domain-containing protein [Actinomycetota bacterium]MBU4391719.1 helix-turn-helix domain-containing protein [Actinomycetota bacterium]
MSGQVNRLVTAQELAELLRVEVAWVWAKSRNGELPHYRAGHYLRYNVNEVLSALHRKDNGSSV